MIGLRIMNKIKVGLYLENKGISEVMISDPTKGNCGIGGTRYEFLYLIQQMTNNVKYQDIDLVVFCNKHQNATFEINEILVDDIKDAFKKCNDLGIDIILLRATDGINDLDILKNTKVIYWLHNFINYDSANKLSSNQKVARCVFVSKQMYDFYLEHDICKKGIVIYNAIPLYSKNEISYMNRNKNAAFVGNIGAWKGFHILLRIWGKVVKKVPEAQLLVIGNAASNNRNVKMGPNNIASLEYETMLLNILRKKHIENNVKFLGLMGVEKKDVLSICKVGVIPSKRETFCLAAIDFVQNGVPVIAKRTTGLIETVSHKHTGILIKNSTSMVNKIVSVLQNKVVLDFDTTYLEKYKPSVVYDDWYELFKSVDALDNQEIKLLSPSKPYFDCYKFVGVVLRKLRKVFKISNRLSRIGIRDLMFRLFKR